MSHLAHGTSAESSSPHSVECLVIGGGIAGCTIAYELASRGQEVLLLERDSLATAASGHNTGTLLSQSEAEVMQMLRESVPIYRELESGPVPFHLRQSTQLLLAQDEAQWEAARKRAEQIAHLGGDVHPVDSTELRRQFPPLRQALAGGYVVSDAWTLDPLGATASFAYAAREAGATIRSHVRVIHLAVQSGRIDGVLTEDGRVSADTVVLATGPWMNELLRDIATSQTWLRLPMGTGRGWLLGVDQLPAAVPWVIEEIAWPDQEVLGKMTRLQTLAELASRTQDQPAVEAFVLAPMVNGGALLGASLAPALRGATEGIEMPQRLARHALDLAPGLGDVQVANAWYGFRPMMADGLPVAGEMPIAGLYVHGGHGSLGMQSAPATARWLANVMLGRSAAAERPWLDPLRFTAL
ncbi:MAG: NAD(P)/FAD-dependent oxidoreductase [Ktedonobacterales bacterium]